MDSVIGLLLLTCSVLLLMLFLVCDARGKDNKRRWISRMTAVLHGSEAVQVLVYEGCLLVTAVSFHVYVTESGNASVFDPFVYLGGTALWFTVAVIAQFGIALRFNNQNVWLDPTPYINKDLEAKVEKSRSPSEGIEKALRYFVTKRGEDDIEAMISFLEHLSLRSDEVGVAARMKLEAMRKQLPDKSGRPGNDGSRLG
jgi:hypothetical protein